MEFRYWKAVIRYGHVGHKNEVSVARYVVFPSEATINDVMAELNNMPGTKNKGIASLQTISSEEYIIGKRMEQENFYLQNLFEKSTA